MKKKIVVAITGASGVIYGIRMLMHLRKSNVESHLILSASGRKNIEIETDFSVAQVEALADHVHRENNMCAPMASGSFPVDGMVVMPCTVKTLSGIVHSYNENLIVRAADVMLKEKRKLIIVVRETPLHKGHLEMMARAADLGALMLPPMPAFYHRPETIADIVDQTIGKAFDYLGIPHHLFERWQGMS